MYPRVGNPNLPHLFPKRADHAPAPTGPAPAPQPVAMRWCIYWLRERGVKLPREAVLQTARTGYLSVEMLGPQARLQDRHGNELGRLDEVRLRLLLPTGALMLRGTELCQDRRTLRDFPQAWWCVPEVAVTGR